MIQFLTPLDIIICEDDPYSFLQFPDYKVGQATNITPTTPREYLTSLAPSFLEFDTQGRIIRLDTFSKVSLDSSTIFHKPFTNLPVDISSWNSSWLLCSKSNIHRTPSARNGSGKSSSVWVVTSHRHQSPKQVGSFWLC